MPNDDLAYLSASEALRRFRDGSLSPVEMTNAVLDRLAATEGAVNAITLDFPDAARRAAQEAEARYRGRGPAPRPLEGLCIAIKDSTDLAGQPSSAGSLLTSDAPAKNTTLINARVLAAGGIVHARSTTPEFSCATTTWSRKWGVTRNPWALARTPGGSSGGAGAALAAGSATLALGSDIAGSLRIPAACCGVVAYKPPRGRVPQEPPFNFDPYCHVGPMARHVDDLALVQNVLAGPDPRDPFSHGVEGGALVPGSGTDLSGVRVAWSEDLGGFAVDPEVRTGFRAARDVFAGLGAHLTEVALDWGPEVVAAARGHLEGVFGHWIADAAAGREALLTPYARHFVEAARALPRDSALQALQVAGRMGARFGAVMAAHDLFICPTLACAPVAAEHDPSKDPLTIEGVCVDPLIGWVLTVPFNMLSMYPVLAVPSGRDGAGCPQGLQIVGHARDERLLFGAAQAFETARGPWYIAGAPRPDLTR